MRCSARHVVELSDAGGAHVGGVKQRIRKVTLELRRNVISRLLRTHFLLSPGGRFLRRSWLALGVPSSTRRSRAAASSRPTCRQPALRRRVRCSHQSLTGHSPQQWSSRCRSRWRSRPEGLCTLPAPNQTAAASFFRRPSACYAVLVATPLTWLVRATSTSPSARRQAQSSRLRATL